MIEHTDFAKAFTPGSKLEFQCDSQTLEATFNIYNIGDLVVTSGQLIVCEPPPRIPRTIEPYIGIEELCFTEIIPCGRYPVVLSVADYPQVNGPTWQTNACAMVVLNEQLPVKWKPAIRNEDLKWLKENEEDIFGYGVDGGIASFMDADAAKQLVTKMSYGDFLYQLDRRRETNTDWANICLNDSTGLNYIFFSSGIGDGTYGSYWGYDINDNIVSLVTDFYLFSPEDQDEDGEDE